VVDDKILFLVFQNIGMYNTYYNYTSSE